MGAFSGPYRTALQGYLLAGGEGQLRIAYELGRRAVAGQLSVLELSDVHHEALLDALAGVDDPMAVGRIVVGAGDFLRETLSAYEMVQRGVREVRASALAERRHAAMLRQVSDLLADGSLALDAPGSLEEMALLLAEQARELCAGDACLVTLAAHGAREEVGAVACEPGEPGWDALLGDPVVRRLPDLAAPAAKGLRLDGAALASLIAFHRLAIASATGRSLRGWLVAPLASLAGDRLGAIQLFTTSDRGFGEREEQVAVHLAQMAAAALERRSRSPGAG
jgi:GAF domain-containing protein